MDTQNQNNDDQWIQIADQTWDIVSTAIDFSPNNTPGPVDCVSKDSKPHEYFLHLFGEEFLDTVVAISWYKFICSMLREKSHQKVTLEVHPDFVNGNLQIVKSF